MDRRFPTADLLRGEFTAPIGGKTYSFGTTLGAIAQIEANCGDRSIMEIVGSVVSGRRAAEQLALIAAALKVTGVTDAETVAATADVPEAEGFTLALMGALGFRLTPRGGEGSSADAPPLPASNAGGAGASSRSAA